MSYDIQDFNNDVLRQSNIKPVIVDYWAPWCAPCRTLSLALENLAFEGKNRWALVKVDTQEHESLAADQGIRTIPTVKLYHREKVLAEFTGAPPEAELRLWLEDNLPPPEPVSLARTADWIRSGNAGDALKMLTELLEANADDQELACVTARSLVFFDPDCALALVDDIAVSESTRTAVNITHVFARLFSMLDDPDSYLSGSPLRDRYLSGALALRRERYDDSLGHFLAVLEEVPDYDGDKAKAACLAIFDHLGNDHPVTESRLSQFQAATEH